MFSFWDYGTQFYELYHLIITFCLLSDQIYQGAILRKPGGVCQAMVLSNGSLRMLAKSRLQRVGGQPGGASGRKWGESGRCRQYPGLAATLSSRSRQAGCVWWRGRAVSDTQYGSWHSQHQVRQVISVSCQWPERGPSEAPDPGVTPSECELTTGG